jgi:hypothetical protein
LIKLRIGTWPGDCIFVSEAEATGVSIPHRSAGGTRRRIPVKKTDERVTKANAEASLRNGHGLDQRLEAMVSELLGMDVTSDGVAVDAVGAKSLPASNGATKKAGKKTKEEEIESLLERMIFSAETFAQYSH